LEVRVSCSAIVQLPCTRDPPHAPFTDAGLNIKARMQPDSLETRLL